MHVDLTDPIYQLATNGGLPPTNIHSDRQSKVQSFSCNNQEFPGDANININLFLFDE